MWPPPPGQCHEKATGRLPQPAALESSSCSWVQVSAASEVCWNVKPYLSNCGHPPLTQAVGVGELQQSARANSLFASTHCCTVTPRNSMTISPLAAQHHMSVSCGRSVTARWEVAA